MRLSLAPLARLARVVQRRSTGQTYVDALMRVKAAEMIADGLDRGYVADPSGQVWYPRGDACVWPRGDPEYGTNARDWPVSAGGTMPDPMPAADGPTAWATRERAAHQRWRDHMTVAELRGYLDRYEPDDVLAFETEQFDGQGTQVYRAARLLGPLIPRAER